MCLLCVYNYNITIMVLILITIFKAKRKIFNLYHYYNFLF